MNTTHDCTIELKEAKLQITPARIAAMQLFESHEEPVDAQHIMNHLQKTLGIDRVTVFRMLNTFAEKGLIRKLEFGEGKARYELNSEEHHHLICQQCASIEDIPHFDDPTMDRTIKETKGFLVKFHSVEFFGTCKDCQMKNAKKIS